MGGATAELAFGTTSLGSVNRTNRPIGSENRSKRRLRPGKLTRFDAVGGFWLVAARDGSAVLFQGSYTFRFGSRVGNFDDLRANNDTVGLFTDDLEVFPGRDAESDGKRKIGLTTDTGNHCWELVVDFFASPRDTERRNNIDKSVRTGDEMGDARVGSRGGNQGHVRESVVAAEIPELGSLLRWGIDNDEAIHTGIDARLEEFLLSVDQERVVVAEEDDGSFETLGAGLLDVVQALGDIGSIHQSTLKKHLGRKKDV